MRLPSMTARAALTVIVLLGSAPQTSALITFPGFTVYQVGSYLASFNLPAQCTTALTSVIACDVFIQNWQQPAWRGALGNATLTDSICDAGCGASLATYFKNVQTNCAGYNMSGYPLTIPGGYIYDGWNQTCLKDTATGKYCNDIIDAFTYADANNSILLTTETCSSCYVKRNAMLQSSQYSIYNTYFAGVLKSIYATCGLTGPTNILPSILPQKTTGLYCLSGQYYTTKSGDTCDTIAELYNVSSAALYMANTNATWAVNCNSPATGTTFCLPPACAEVYTFNSNDTCTSIEQANSLAPGTVRNLNAWIQYACTNLQVTNAIYGNVVCLAPLGGTFIPTTIAANATTDPSPVTGYILQAVAPPNVTVAKGTTLQCGLWHVAVEGDTCVGMTVQAGITAELFLLVNPSLSSTATNCSSTIMLGSAYCIGPTYEWNETSTTTGSAVLNAASATAVPSSSKYGHLGCYSEPLTVADGKSTYSYVNMTLEGCALFCADQYPLWGVRDGGICYCGKSPATPYGPVAWYNCDTTCPGNKAQNCGGDGFLNMFTLGAAPSSTSSMASSTKASSSATSSKASTSSSKAATSTSSSKAATSTSSSNAATTSSKVSTSSTSSAAATPTNTYNIYQWVCSGTATIYKYAAGAIAASAGVCDSQNHLLSIETLNTDGGINTGETFTVCNTQSSITSIDTLLHISGTTNGVISTGTCSKATGTQKAASCVGVPGDIAGLTCAVTLVWNCNIPVC